jgi:ParB/RepB/Spo0J family partition protein
MSDTSTTLSASPTIVRLEEIDPNPYQPRLSEDAEAVEKLAESIRSIGLLQIPSARQVDGRYQLAFGHSRKAAYQELAGQDERYGSMPLYIHELDDLQMFEMGVTENIQRRELNPVETALAMQRYMTGFGKTSEEAGMFFGCNAATVRGKVRLLDLPEPAQAKLADGTINEGTARALLSMAKVASPKDIQKTLTDIEKNEDHESPEEIVENAIDRNDNVISMHQNHSWIKKEKPRAGNGLWLLDMKNFPNKLLPVLTPTEAVIALGVVSDSSATDGVEAFFEDGGEDGLTNDQATRLKHLINPPACTACPYYMTMGGTHYCGLKICHERKKAAFLAQKMADLSRTLKIGIYTEADGPYLVLETDVLNHKKAFEQRHADLRLLPRQEFHRGYAWQRFEGLDDDVALLVAVGAALEKLAVKGSTSVGKKSEKEKAEMRAMRQYRLRRKELLWEYTAAAQSLFEGVPLETLEMINGWNYIGIDDRIPNEYEQKANTAGEKLEYERRALVWRLIVGETSYFQREELAGLLDEFHKNTQVKAPKALVKRALEWDAEIHDLARVAVETKKKGK